MVMESGVVAIMIIVTVVVVVVVEVNGSGNGIRSTVVLNGVVFVVVATLCLGCSSLS